MPDTTTLVCLACAQANRIPASKLAAYPKCGVCGSKLADGRVAELNPQTLCKAIKTDRVPLVVDFWAPWCGPCRMMAPQFSAAAASMAAEVRFAKINTQDFEKVNARFGIRGIPLLILFDKGREVARLSGARPAAEIQRFVQSARMGQTQPM